MCLIIINLLVIIYFIFFRQGDLLLLATISIFLTLLFWCFCCCYYFSLNTTLCCVTRWNQALHYYNITLLTCEKVFDFCLDLINIQLYSVTVSHFNFQRCRLLVAFVVIIFFMKYYIILHDETRLQTMIMLYRLI